MTSSGYLMFNFTRLEAEEVVVVVVFVVEFVEEEVDVTTDEVRFMVTLLALRS
jgi:hypothetical protein